MWITWILRNWQLAVIASLLVALMLSMSLGRMWKAERDEKIAVIDSMRREAQSYKERSETIAKETADGFTLLVEQIKDKDTAIKNARTRFQTCNAAHGVRADWLQPLPTGSGEADSPAGTDESPPERLVVDRTFIDACAIDVAQILSWQDWARKNDLVQ
jgi:hypothetical protein